MHGNVWEWCQDWYGDYHSNLIEDPTGPETGEECVVRGGGWFYLAGYCRSALRGHWAPSLRSGWLGFRLARGP